MLLAYQTAAFSGLAANGRLKDFRHYASQLKVSPNLKNMTALHYFRTLQAKGLPVKINRVSKD